MIVLDKPPQAYSIAGVDRCLLFVYGQLQPGGHEPKTASHAWPDRVQGLLYDLGDYPAATNISQSNCWFHGFVLDLDNAELDDLDRFEAVSKSMYRRIRVTTEAGFNAWIYEYARSLPNDAVGPIERWVVPRRRAEG